jgi:hypothetical protein
MSSIYEYRTIKTAMPKLPPAKPTRPMGFSMADLIADAKAAEERQSKAWGEHLFTDDEAKPSRNSRTRWTPERMARLRAIIIAALIRHGPMTLEDLNHHVRINRHKLKDTMAEFRKEGIAESKQITNQIHRWSLV